MLSRPIPLRLLLAAQPKLVTPLLQVVHRVITRPLLGQARLKPDEADSGAVTLIQRFGSAANLNIHLHCLVLDGLYRMGADGVGRDNHPVRPCWWTPSTAQVPAAIGFGPASVTSGLSLQGDGYWPSGRIHRLHHVSILPSRSTGQSQQALKRQSARRSAAPARSCVLLVHCGRPCGKALGTGLRGLTHGLALRGKGMDHQGQSAQPHAGHHGQ